MKNSYSQRTHQKQANILDEMVFILQMCSKYNLSFITCANEQ